jgi:hypothetical protein
MGPEAVGAIDRPVHPWLERDLGLIAARRAEDREILAGRSLAALVAARSTDVSEVRFAAVSSGSPAGAAAGAALGIRDEPLLHIELLVGGGVDEFHAAVDAGDGSI